MITVCRFFNWCIMVQKLYIFEQDIKLRRNNFIKKKIQKGSYFPFCILTKYIYLCVIFKIFRTFLSKTQSKYLNIYLCLKIKYLNVIQFKYKNNTKVHNILFQTIYKLILSCTCFERAQILFHHTSLLTKILFTKRKSQLKDSKAVIFY